MPSHFFANDDAREDLLPGRAIKENAIYGPEAMKKLRECGCGESPRTSEAGSYGTLNPSLQAAPKKKVKTKPVRAKRKMKLKEAVKNDVNRGKIRKQTAKTKFSKVKTSTGGYRKEPVSSGRSGGVAQQT